jgi:hypothetical protein
MMLLYEMQEEDEMSRASNGENTTHNTLLSRKTQIF